jgi:hypothetical protein
VEVRTEPFDDRSEPEADGLYEYIYVGANVHFDADGETLTFRLYDDEPGRAALVAPPGWRPDVYAGSLFRDAVVYLRERHGVGAVHVYHSETGTLALFGDAVDSAQRLGLPLPSDAVVRDLGATTNGR